MGGAVFKSRSVARARNIRAKRGEPARAPGVPRYLAASSGGIRLSTPNDRLEREAEAAARAEPEPGRAAAGGARAAPAAAAAGSSAAVGQAVGGGRALDADVRADMEARFGRDLSAVRVHTGTAAAALSRDIGARAFTHGSDIFFGEGLSPGRNPTTTHELAHVVQQTGGSRWAGLSAHAGEPMVQREFGSFPLGNGLGGFEMAMAKQEGAVDTPPTHSGLSGTIRFIPTVGAPNSNSISLIQIVRVTDTGGSDVNPVTLPAGQAPRGALGTPGVRTEEDVARGVEGGFFTDVLHQDFGGNVAAPGSALGPAYPFAPGGGSQTPGFKRSDDPSDIRSAVLFDAPGTASPTTNVDFKFETAAVGEDTQLTYGAIHWGFQLRNGRVTEDAPSVASGASATFGEALERHRDFYVHEPVTFYFGFDRRDLEAGEAAKIDSFLPYLARNPDVEMLIEGFADQAGGNSDYNRTLSLDRASAVQAALLARGIAEDRVVGILIGRGASTAATTNAGTGDQPGGNPARGADQSREANRWANRRVVVTFRHKAPAPAGTP